MSRFNECLPLVLKHEGGYVNHPADPGGATNQGITQRTYDAWNKRAGKTTRSVRHITAEEVAAIYRAQYWDKVQADDLSAGLDYAVFDFAVNSGPARAAKFLQRIVGVEQDGIIGAQTIAAASGMVPASLIRKLCDDRLAWLKRLKTWKHFGRGWERRVNEVKGAALNMSDGMGYQEPVGEACGRAEGAEKVTATIKDMVKDPKSVGGIAGLLAALGGIIEGSEAMQYALAAVIVLGAAMLAYKLVKRVMIGAIFRWLGSGALDRILATVDRKVQSETDREKIKGEIIKEAYSQRGDYMRAGGFLLMMAFAAPLAFWWASVMLYSVFWCQGCAYPQPWSVAALPAPLDEWAGLIVVSIFGVIGVTRLRK